MSCKGRSRICAKWKAVDWLRLCALLCESLVGGGERGLGAGGRPRVDEDVGGKVGDPGDRSDGHDYQRESACVLWPQQKEEEVNPRNAIRSDGQHPLAPTSDEFDGKVELLTYSTSGVG